MMTPSATFPTGDRLLGGGDPEADRHRDVGLVLGRRGQLGQLGRQLGSLAGDAHRRDEIDEPPSPPRRSSLGARRGWWARRAGSGRGHGRPVRRRSGPAPRAGGPERSRRRPPPRPRARRSPRPRTPGSCSSRPSARPGSAPQPGVQVSSTDSRVAPASSAAVSAAWIVGPSASGSEKGTPSSIKSAPEST